MSTFYSIVNLLKSSNLKNYELTFLSAHSVIIDHGLKIKSQNQETIDPFYFDKDNFISLKVLPENWRIKNIASQAYSVTYMSPLSSVDTYKGAKEICLKALIMGNKMIFHVSNSLSPDKLTSFEVSLNSESITRILNIIESPNFSNEINPFNSLYSLLYQKLHNNLINLDENQNSSIIEKNQQNFKPEIENSTTCGHPTQYLPVSKPSLLSEAELVGPNHPLFSNRMQFDIRKRVPGIDFEPFDPLNTNLDSDSDAMPRLGGPNRPFI